MKVEILLYEPGNAQEGFLVDLRHRLQKDVQTLIDRQAVVFLAQKVVQPDAFRIHG